MNNTTNEIKRIPAFDIIKLIAIFLVIWGHCIQGFFSTDCANSPIFRIIYSFHMPLFMMISGYFSVSSMAMDSRNFLKKKISQLIYPCITWGIILWIVLELMNSFHYGNKYFSIVGLISDFYWLSDFWFLKSCFICYLLVFLGAYSKTKKPTWMFTTLIISQFISPFFVSFLYPCFLIGYELKQNKVFFTKILSYKHLFLIIFIIMLVFWDKEMWIRSHGIPTGILTANLNDWMVLLFSRLYRLLIGIIGSIAFFTINYDFFNKTLKCPKVYSLYADWGRYTLRIYILQNIILEKGICSYIKLDQMDFLTFNFVITPSASLFILIICVYLAKIIERYPPLNRILWDINKKV